MTITGVDYSAGRPGGAALAAAGMRFAARYLSHNPSKNLTPSEARDLAAHGVSCVVVWETTAQRAGAGRAAGIADAKEAAAQAQACGMPPSRPLYFAVDYDAAPDKVAAYFGGVVSVLGLARTGVYGGYKVVSYLLDHHLATWAWQTVAWSGGKWDARAHIRQYASTVRINGVVCDKDTAMTADYGQWMPGKTPSVQEDNVQLTDKYTVPAGAWSDKAQTASVGAWLAYGNLKAEWAARHAQAAEAGVKALTAQVAALSAAVGALAKGGGLTATEITAAAQAGAQAALAELGDALTPDTPAAG